MQITEMKEHVVQKLRLIATLYFDRQGAFKLLAERVVVWANPDGTENVYFRTSPGRGTLIPFERLLEEQYRSRRLNCRTLALSVLHGALDDSPPKFLYLLGRNPQPDTLDTIERRRVPGVNYPGYFGLWPIN